MERDDSCVFERALLDGQYQRNFRHRYLFQTEDGIRLFPTQEGACEAQRRHRIKHGFDPITGERLPE